eukprot:3027973-Amphidinium_carterae.1
MRQHSQMLSNEFIYTVDASSSSPRWQCHWPMSTFIWHGTRVLRPRNCTFLATGGQKFLHNKRGLTSDDLLNEQWLNLKAPQHHSLVHVVHGLRNYVPLQPGHSIWFATTWVLLSMQLCGGVLQHSHLGGLGQVLVELPFLLHKPFKLCIALLRCLCQATSQPSLHRVPRVAAKSVVTSSEDGVLS